MFVDAVLCLSHFLLTASWEADISILILQEDHKAGRCQGQPHGDRASSYAEHTQQGRAQNTCLVILG